MLDPVQGKFLIRNYNKNSREHLVKAIEAFYKYHKNNIQKIKEIEGILVDSFGVHISCLRVSELLLWIQTQLSLKDIKKTLIETCITCRST